MPCFEGFLDDGRNTAVLAGIWRETKTHLDLYLDISSVLILICFL